MINYGNLTVSKYARVLCLNNQCVIGNIATDGRWIKIPRNTWDHIISMMFTLKKIVFFRFLSLWCFWL